MANITYTEFIKAYFYDIMSSSPDDVGCYCLGFCDDIHLDNCWQYHFCFYNDMLNACLTALEMGWA